MAKGYQDPDLRTGNVDITGWVSRSSPHLQVISLGALTKWPLWSLDIKNAFPQVGGFDREVYLRAPCGWGSKEARRAWKSRAPAHELNDAPVAPRRSLRKFLVDSAESLASVGLRFKVTQFGPRAHFICRESEKAAGVVAAHIDGVSGRGEPDLFLEARGFYEDRFGKLAAQEGAFVNVGMEVSQEKDFSATSTQENFTRNLKRRQLRAGRQEPLSPVKVWGIALG